MMTTNNQNNKRLTLKEYILRLDYTFEEFDKIDYDGSYFTKWGKLGEFTLFSEEEIDETLEEEREYFDKVSDEDFEDIIGNLVNNLDQGAVRFLEIKDGDKIIYEDSNEEPFED